jgi:hypothetical protein
MYAIGRKLPSVNPLSCLVEGLLCTQEGSLSCQDGDRLQMTQCVLSNFYPWLFASMR